MSRGFISGQYHTHTYKRTYLPTYLPTYVRTYVHTYMHTYTRIHINIYIHMQIYRYVCVSCKRTHIHVCIHTLMHILTPSLRGEIATLPQAAVIKNLAQVGLRCPLRYVCGLHMPHFPAQLGCPALHSLVWKLGSLHYPMIPHALIDAYHYLQSFGNGAVSIDSFPRL